MRYVKYKQCVSGSHSYSVSGYMPKGNAKKKALVAPGGPGVAQGAPGKKNRRVRSYIFQCQIS